MNTHKTSVRGRPKGTATDDTALIADIRRSMREDPKLSRRAAIVASRAGLDGLRRIEIKMLAADRGRPVGLDRALEDGPEAALAFVASQVRSELTSWEVELVGFVYSRAAADAKMFGRFKSLGKVDDRIVDHFLDWLLLDYLLASALRHDESPLADDLSTLLADMPFDPVLHVYQRQRFIDAWNLGTERIRHAFGLPDAVPREPWFDVDVWPRQLVAEGSLPSVDALQAILADSVGEPYVGVLSMPLSLQIAAAIVTGIAGDPSKLYAAMDGTIDDDEVLAILKTVWTAEAVSAAEVQLGRSAWSVPAVLHAAAGRGGENPFRSDLRLYAALQWLDRRSAHLGGMGAYLHYLAEARFDVRLETTVFGPAVERLVSRDRRSGGYWQAVAAVIDESVGRDVVGDPHDLLYRGWSQAADHAALLSGWLASGSGGRWLESVGMSDPSARSAMHLYVVAYGRLPELEASLQLREVVFNGIDRSFPSVLAGRLPGDFSMRVATVLAFEKEHGHGRS